MFLPILPLYDSTPSFAFCFGKEVLVVWCTHYRNLLGEDLAPLSTSELDQLEIQVDKTLKQIRSRKVRISRKVYVK